MTERNYRTFRCSMCGEVVILDYEPIVVTCRDCNIWLWYEVDLAGPF